MPRFLNFVINVIIYWSLGKGYPLERDLVYHIKEVHADDAVKNFICELCKFSSLAFRDHTYMN